MRMMYFCYERSSVDRHWEPVVYYDEKPRASSQSKESTPDRSTIWDVPLECCDDDDLADTEDRIWEPNFGKLQKRFPKP